jgi:hypothetical protein
MPATNKVRPHLRFVLDRQTEAHDPTSEHDRRRQIAELAYYKAQLRGFEAGHECEDWLEAEREIEARWRADQTPPFLFG